MNRRKTSFIAMLAMAIAPACSFAAEHSPGDWNFTGPLLTPSPSAMPKGVLYMEPYLVYMHSDAYYGDKGHRKHSANSDQRQILVSMSYGLSKRITALASLGAAHISTGANHTSGLGMTDSSLGLLYVLQAPNADYTRPAIAVALAHQFPTGTYDHLRKNPTNGLGDGTQRTTLSLRAQQILWMPSGRPLKWRAMLAWSPRPPRVSVDGDNIYYRGTTPLTPAFHGRVSPGTALSASIGLEYAFNPHWVAAFDVAATREGKSHLVGEQPGLPVNQPNRFTTNYSVAPAIEYNFNSNFGIIAGVQASVGGRRSSAFVSPQIALSMIL